jgi:hypothetical protein
MELSSKLMNLVREVIKSIRVVRVGVLEVNCSETCN